ncbi:MAG: hypothetical protein ACI9N3_000338 [Colwellia sp.]|jgi:hypothetical protein
MITARERLVGFMTNSDDFNLVFAAVFFAVKANLVAKKLNTEVMGERGKILTLKSSVVIDVCAYGNYCCSLRVTIRALLGHYLCRRA